MNDESRETPDILRQGQLFWEMMRHLPCDEGLSQRDVVPEYEYVMDAALLMFRNGLCTEAELIEFGTCAELWMNWHQLGYVVKEI